MCPLSLGSEHNNNLASPVNMKIDMFKLNSTFGPVRQALMMIVMIVF